MSVRWHGMEVPTIIAGAIDAQRAADLMRPGQILLLPADHFFVSAVIPPPIPRPEQVW